MSIKDCSHRFIVLQKPVMRSRDSDCYDVQLWSGKKVLDKLRVGVRLRSDHPKEEYGSNTGFLSITQHPP